ncbi:MAG: cation diffusion facilitator family transporter [Candidatus Eisenbacteria bacterium]
MIRRITWVGAAINVVLSLAKLAVGAAAGSIALVADGVHSLSDLATDLVVVVATRLGVRPADEDHPWGHGKYETLGAVVVALAVIVAGAEIGWTALAALRRGEEGFPGGIVLIVAAVSVVSKEWLYRATATIAKRTRSRALMANAWHHRTDSLSSVVVLLGGLFSVAGQGHADQVAGIVVGLMVALTGIRFGREALGELVEGSAGGDVDLEIQRVLEGELMIMGWHALRARRVGRKIFVDLHVVVSPDMTVADADRLAHRIEGEVCRALDSPCNVMVHVDPVREECP